MSTQNRPIRKAVIPVAGLGTRFLPVTRAVPKILLPVLNVPVIEYAVREVVNSGITDIAIVMSRGMESVASYFGEQPELVRTLEERGRAELAALQREISSLANITTLYQDNPKGLGHAVLMARDFVGDEPFAVLLPDDVIWSDTPSTKQLIDVRSAHGGSVIAALEVPDEVVSQKGIIDGDEVADRVVSVRGLVEKPALEDAPSNLSIIGRYVLDPAVFEYLSGEHAGAGGEIQLTDAIEATLGAVPVHACRFKGHHVDTGNPGGMLQAALYEAGRDPALRKLVNEAISAWE
ncbi:MAG: UTP--glucose-1-phosphate uridylyltransferase [Chloroflexi bacterium]|nr:UTP--glucose-1-phosphate uridylyltransferase [Chloroflexota bacterium]